MIGFKCGDIGTASRFHYETYWYTEITPASKTPYTNTEKRRHVEEIFDAVCPKNWKWQLLLQPLTKI